MTDKSILFKNANIIDGSGTDAFPGHVLVEGNCIRSVITGDEIPKDIETIDLGG